MSDLFVRGPSGHRQEPRSRPGRWSGFGRMTSAFALVLSITLSGCASLRPNTKDCPPFNANTGRPQQVVNGVCTEITALPPATTSITVAPPSERDATSVGNNLTTQEAQTWCSGSGCASVRFEPLKESNGLINPRGVHMSTGPPVTLVIPAGIDGNFWDCFAASDASGPTTLKQVCEASLRRRE